MSNSRRRKIHGKAFPISRKEVRAYERADRPRSYKSNPIGVTRMSTVNGRGSYRSARQAAAGKTQTERLSRARKVMRNGSMAGFLRNRKSSGAATRRAAAKRAGAKKRGTAKKNVTRTTMKTNTRRKVPGTNYYRTSNGRYQNAKGKFVKATSVKRSTTTKRKATPNRKRKAAPKRKVRRNAQVGASKSYSAGWDRMKRSEAAKKAAATRKRRQRAAARTAGKRGTVGRYSRLKLEDPRTGKTRRSYMYKTSKGKRRRIPAKAITKSGHMTKTQIRSGRAKAAARIKREGSAFVANKRKSSARQKRAGRRLAAYSAAKRRGASVKKAKAAALRKVPLVTGDSFKGSTKVGPLKKGRRKKVKIAGKKRTLVGNRRRRKTTRKTTRRKMRRNGNTTTMKNNRRRRRKTAAKRRSYKKNRRVGTVKRRTYPNRRRRKATKRRSPVRRNRRRTTKMRRNRRRSYRRNQGFMAKFQKAFVSGLWITGGFLTHKVVTNLICDPIFDLFKPKNGNAATEGVGQANGGFNLDNWKKPICGAGVLAIGLPLVGMTAKKRGVEIGAGMMVSWIHSIIVSIAQSVNQPQFLQAVGDSRSDWSGRTWPYSSSRAAALGRRRRRGVGQARHTTSIMPRYTPIRSMGQFQQAAAGQVYQAAAGQGPGFQQAAAGEYFTPMNATGEFFAYPSTQGVGSYEAAGQLAMPRNNQVIQDGIRPDANLDREMSIMEAAAGLRGGVGSYFEQSDGRVSTVPRTSTWIPGTSDGELWAGETPVDATQQTSELSAGILNVPGGNGILSGG